MPHAQLHADRFAVREDAEAGDEVKEATRRRKLRVVRRRIAVAVRGNAPGFRDGGGDFGSWKDAPVAWLSSLRELDLYHFHLGTGGSGFEFLGVKSARVIVAATEVPRPNLEADNTHTQTHARVNDGAIVAGQAAVF